MIRFLLNNTEVVLDENRADVTVLDWLRTRMHKTGTKEGCGSGDCGACTVVVAQLDDNNLSYQAINSCITFVGALHGKQLITVEDLATGDALHPVQQAMVDAHGSQCGFCTPGFIMSMFAMFHDAKSQQLGKAGNSPELQHRIDRFLGGNLCRCTGYSPIKQAALTALQSHKPDKFDAAETATLGALQSILDKAPMHPRFLVPQSLDELSSMRMNYPDARVLAGGTDLALEVTQQLKNLDSILLITKVPQLLTVIEHDDAIEIGAAVSLSCCMQVLKNIIPTSESLMLRFGSEQVRNQGTVGGNIANASPVGDLPPLLIALNATLNLHSVAGDRQIPVDSYFKDYKVTDLRPDEIIRSVKIPKPATAESIRIYKISKRLDDDISAVCAVFNLHVVNNSIEAATIAFGGMAAIPQRATHTEQSLIGKTLGEQTLVDAQQALAQDYAPISDARASAAYRLNVAANLIRRCFIDLSANNTCTQVIDHVGG